MYEEPDVKRAVAFIDANNTRVAARKAFGESHQNYNPLALAQAVCSAQGWRLAGVYYYLGVPDVKVTEDGHYAWIKRCARWRKQGIHVFTRTMLHDEQGVPREKGIDMRLALDAVDLHRRHGFDVALIFSQDQDFSELAAEIKAIARQQKRWVQVASVYPASDKLAEAHGVSGTRAIVLDEEAFTRVLDTAENRKLSFVPDPVAALPFPLPLAEVAPLPETKAAPNSTLTLAAAQARARLGSPWLAGAAALYLAAAVLTFGERLWQARAALGEAESRPTALMASAAEALSWPLAWLDGDDLNRLKARLAELDPAHPLR